MRNLIKMDLYRMGRSRTFWICLIITAVLALTTAPVSKLLYSLAGSLSSEARVPFPAQVNLSAILKDPFPLMGLMLLLLSLCSFFHADMEDGFIKNIAGQMPRKGYTVLSKFLAAIVHNLIFVMTAIAGKVIGTLVVQRIVPDSGAADGIRVLLLKLLLIQSISAVLLLAVTTLRSKSLGMILAVLFGLGLTPLIYLGISEALTPVFGEGVDISKYMADAVLREDPLETGKAILTAVVTGCIFLPLAIRIFDRKDVN